MNLIFKNESRISMEKVLIILTMFKLTNLVVLSLYFLVYSVNLPKMAFINKGLRSEVPQHEYICKGYIFVVLTFEYTKFLEYQASSKRRLIRSSRTRIKFLRYRLT